MIINQEQYFAYLKNMPAAVHDDACVLVTDETVIKEYALQHPETELGIIENGQFYDIRLFLYQNRFNGTLFRYPSVAHKKEGAASLIRLNGKFLLEKHYRIFFDEYLLEIPRGFGDPTDKTTLTTMLRELAEECGIELSPDDLHMQYHVISLGSFHADTGVMKNTTALFFIEIQTDSDFVPVCRDADESISKFILMDEEQFRDYIRLEKITDGFTLAAFARYTVKSAGRDSHEDDRCF